MPNDVQYYQELRQRKLSAAWVWLAGVQLYNAGLLSAACALPAALVFLAVDLVLMNWRYTLACVVVFCLGIGLCVLGYLLKGLAQRLAVKNGYKSE